MNTAEGHIFSRFDDEMKHLHVLVLEMGTLAVKQLNDAVETLQNEDPERAYEVIDNDAKLNQLDIQADEEIIQLIAKRQPMARDLREIIAVGKIVAELERAGDEARKIAGLTVHFFREGEQPPSPEVLADIFSLAEYVTSMQEIVLEAFDNFDLELAKRVLQKGIKLDAQLKQILLRLSNLITNDTTNVDNFVSIVLGIRALERFGGHAKNIAGHIIFLKSNIDVRHIDVESILETITDS